MPADQLSNGRLIRIDAPDDPRVAAFRSVRERDLTLRDGRFIAEGTVVLAVLADVHGGPGGVEAESILVLENRLGSVAEILERFPSCVPIYLVSRPVIDAIAGFPIHRGVLAVGRRRGPETVAAIVERCPDNALVLAGCGIANHDNMGALFRNAAAFGADATLFDERSCHPLYRKAIRVSVGAALSVPFFHGGSADALVEALHRTGFAVWGLSPRGQTLLRDVPAARRMALIVGSEGSGLSGAMMAGIRTARINQAPGMDSLNVAMAGGIALHHMAGAMGRI